MKKSRLTIVLIFLAFVISATGGCSGGNDVLKEFSVKVYSPEYAEGFCIYAAPGRSSTLVEVKNPWQGAGGVKEYLLILRDCEKAPEGFDGHIINGDAHRIVCMSSTHVAMLEACGVEDRIVGVSGLDFICSQKVRARAISEVGHDGFIDYETIASLHPELVIIYGVNGASPLESRLDNLEIPYLYFGEYLEENPLGKAEWMVLAGEISGCRDYAIAHFSPIPERYDSIKNIVRTLPKPKVMMNTPYADAWFLPSTKSYMARLVNDAGGDYIYKDNSSNSSAVISIEQALSLAMECDCWINASGVGTLAALKNKYPYFSDCPCVISSNVYDSDRRTSEGGGNDFWESGTVNPDVILSDLAAIFHPEIFSVAEDSLYYYRKLR